MSTGMILLHLQGNPHKATKMPISKQLASLLERRSCTNYCTALTLGSRPATLFMPPMPNARHMMRLDASSFLNDQCHGRTISFTSKSPPPGRLPTMAWFFTYYTLKRSRRRPNPNQNGAFKRFPSLQTLLPPERRYQRHGAGSAMRSSTRWLGCREEFLCTQADSSGETRPGRACG